MQSILPSKIGELVSVDLVGPLPVSRGGTTQLLVCVDSFSKLVRLYPLRKVTSKAISNALASKCLEELGCPQKVLSDNGSQFCSSLCLAMPKEREIQAIHTSVYYPQGCYLVFSEW